MRRYFVTGTDTDVGKTRVTAALALALRLAGESPTIVKIVQTGVKSRGEGDAVHAGRLAGVPYLELARFQAGGDPWSSALAEGLPPLTAERLAEELDKIPGTIVAEGIGGIMVPLNPSQTIGHVAALAKLEAVVAVGLRLGCLNHAMLTRTFCRELNIPVAGALLVERWGRTDPTYRDRVYCVLQGSLPVLGVLAFSAAETQSVEAGAKLFESLVKQER
ncbi:MAG TPA: dethiobiotin synthase [Candidatus Cybelea sp.]|jgi:dethiobiotin synthetase|nr:dethiobiotin synthase [Candidatus Cybelea sp.]